jgi:hypothetical protein
VVSWIGKVVKSIWESEAVYFTKSVLLDVWKGANIILGMMLMFWVFKLAGAGGYDVEKLGWFEKVHFGSSLSAYSVICALFVGKLAVGAYGRRKK